MYDETPLNINVKYDKGETDRQLAPSGTYLAFRFCFRHDLTKLSLHSNYLSYPCLNCTCFFWTSFNESLEQYFYYI